MDTTTVWAALDRRDYAALRAACEFALHLLARTPSHIHLVIDAGDGAPQGSAHARMLQLHEVVQRTPVPIHVAALRMQLSYLVRETAVPSVPDVDLDIYDGEANRIRSIEGYATVTEAQRVASRNACARRNADSDLPSMATLTDPERVVRRLRRGTQPVYVLALDGDRLSLLPLLQPARLRIFWEAEREERVSEEYTDAAWRALAIEEAAPARAGSGLNVARYHTLGGGSGRLHVALDTVFRALVQCGFSNEREYAGKIRSWLATAVVCEASAASISDCCFIDENIVS